MPTTEPTAEIIPTVPALESEIDRLERRRIERAPRAVPAQHRVQRYATTQRNEAHHKRSVEAMPDGQTVGG